MATGPTAPIFAAPPHVTCPVGPLQGWFTDPPGAVVQLTEATEFTIEMARWLVGPGFALLHERFQSRSERLVLLLDIRPMTSRDPAVRTLFMETAREQGGRFAAVVVIPPLQINPVYRTTLQAAAALVSAFGIELEITTQIGDALTRHQLRLS